VEQGFGQSIGILGDLHALLALRKLAEMIEMRRGYGVRALDDEVHENWGDANILMFGKRRAMSPYFNSIRSLGRSFDSSWMPLHFTHIELGGSSADRPWTGKLEHCARTERLLGDGFFQLAASAGPIL
jgi:hypothetical protein